MCIIDTEGKILATTFSEADRYVSPAMALVDSPADSQVVSGCHFFKVFDEHQLEYVLLANGDSDECLHGWTDRKFPDSESAGCI